MSAPVELEEDAPEQPLTSSQRAAVLATTHLIAPRARRVETLFDGAVEIDELMAHGAITLSRAIRDFEPAPGRNLEEYAGWRVYHAMLDRVRVEDTQSRVKRAIAKAAAVAAEGIGVEYDDDRAAARQVEGAMHGLVDNMMANAFIAAAIEAQRRSAEEAEDDDELDRAAEVIQRAIAGFPERRRAVFQALREEGATLVAVAKQLGVAVKTVQRDQEQSIRELRKALQSAGITRPPAAAERGRVVQLFGPRTPGALVGRDPPVSGR